MGLTGTITEEKVLAILKDFYKKIDEKILRLEGSGVSKNK
jgi:hypothetical protein